MLSVLSSSAFSSFARRRGSPSGSGLPIQTLTLPPPPRSGYLRPSIFQQRTSPPTPIPTLQIDGTVSASISLASTSYMSGPGSHGIDPGLLEPSDITIAIRKMLGPSAFQCSASLQLDSTAASPSTSGRPSIATRDVEAANRSELLKLPQPSRGETGNVLSKCCSISALASSPLSDNDFESASRKHSESIILERRSSDTHTVSSLHAIATANLESQAEPGSSAAAVDDPDALPSQAAPSRVDFPTCDAEQSTPIAVKDVIPVDVEGKPQQSEHNAMTTEEVEVAAPILAVGLASGSRFVETGLLDCSSAPTSASGCTAASDFDGGSIFRSEPDVQPSTKIHEFKAFSILSFLPRRSKGTLPFSDATLTSKTSEGPNAGLKSLFGKIATPVAKRPKVQSQQSGGHSQFALPNLVSFKSLSLVFA